MFLKRKVSRCRESTLGPSAYQLQPSASPLGQAGWQPERQWALYIYHKQMSAQSGSGGLLITGVISSAVIQPERDWYLKEWISPLEMFVLLEIYKKQMKIDTREREGGEGGGGGERERGRNTPTAQNLPLSIKNSKTSTTPHLIHTLGGKKPRCAFKIIRKRIILLSQNDTLFLKTYYSKKGHDTMLKAYCLKFYLIGCLSIYRIHCFGRSNETGM